MELAIKEFSLLDHQNKYIVLGDMLELSKYSNTEHKKIIELLKSIKFKNIILVGTEFQKFKSNIDCLHFNDYISLSKWLNRQIFSNTTFFVKGSRGIQLEKAFTGLYTEH
jgi:UDP-N-acetylmuramoyl-tripeptide--D-alanyl-D-alanine ligase